MLGAHAHKGYSTPFVCLSVTSFLASSQVYMTKYTYLHVFLLDFLGFQLTDFDKTLSFGLERIMRR